MKPSRWCWQLDEVFENIDGERHDLWRAVGNEGEVPENVVSKTRDKMAAPEFLKKTCVGTAALQPS